MQEEYARAGRPCALKILSLTENDRVPCDGHPLKTVLLDAFEVAALEFFEGNLRPLSGDYQGQTLVLQIMSHTDPRHGWSVWLDDCIEGPYKPELYWRRDEDGDRGPVHAALSANIREGLEIAASALLRQEGMIVIRADISAVSAHQKMRMAETRAKIVG